METSSRRLPLMGQPRWCARALFGAILLAACATPGPKGPLLMHPLPPTAANYRLEQGALIYTGEGFSVSVRPWDWRLVEEEFRRTGERNPFGAQEGETGRFLFFRIRFENRAAQPLVFNSLRASLYRPDDAPILPVENSDLYLFASDDKDVEARGRAFRRLSFDGAATVRPGETLERYLVFPAPEEAKEFVLALDVWLGKEGSDLLFLLEAYPGEEPSARTTP